MNKELIIDIQSKGNLLNLALTSKIDPNTHGDDWDDAPYESNAGEVYEQYVDKYKTVIVPFNKSIMSHEEMNGILNSKVSMLDCFHKKQPFLYIVDSLSFDICDIIYLTDDLKDHPILKPT